MMKKKKKKNEKKKKIELSVQIEVQRMKPDPVPRTKMNDDFVLVEIGVLGVQIHKVLILIVIVRVHR